MQYTFENGKKINIPDEEIKKLEEKLQITTEEAIEIWLDDKEYTSNEEQQELDNKARQVRISHGASDDTKTGKKGGKKPVSAEKIEIFKHLVAFVDEYSKKMGGNYSISKENKLISLNIEGKNFKIDLIESRK